MTITEMNTNKSFDVAVVGAGVFGAWTAYLLARSGAKVVLLDAYGAGNNRASSGGESRMIRMGYGTDEIYTRMAQRSLRLWQELFDHRSAASLFQPTGILWLAQEQDVYCEATVQTLQRCQINHERLDRAELNRRYPTLELGAVGWGILEPESGVLMARQAVRAVVAEAKTIGVTYWEDAIVPPPNQGKLNSLATVSGGEVFADQFVFACGPWLPKLFPDLLGQLIQVTRQEVFFFGLPASHASSDSPLRSERMPAWIDFTDLVYGIPSLDQRGFKIAIDAHGPPFDPDTGDRLASSEGLAAVRAYLSTRLPILANAPVTESRVCQYENTSNGDFLIDRHPEFANVWLVGGGSGHGFKHGPAVGEHVSALISNHTKVETRFCLAAKEKVQLRKVY